jgi:hypothetical protein
MREDTMVERDRRFLLKVPPGYFEMTEEQQQAAAVAMWRAAMTRLGEDPDKLVGESAQDECPDNQV